MCLSSSNRHGILGHIFGPGGINSLSILSGNLDKGVILYAVIGNEDGFHPLFAHLADNLGCLRMITAKYDRFGFRAFNFLNNCGIIDSARGNSFVQNNLCLRGFL